MSRFVWNNRLSVVLIFCWLALGVVVPVLAEEAEEETPEVTETEEPRWKGTAGVAVLATSGNTDTETLGFEVTGERRPDPWGLAVEARFDRAKEDDELTAEHLLAAIRGKRTAGEHWQIFAGMQAEQDEFAGLKQRILLETGGTLKAIEQPKHTLSFDFGVTWTDEDRLSPAPDTDSLGALLGFGDHWQLSETATLDERLVVYLNFDESDDWRLDYRIALTAALTERLAMKVGYELRYRNRPIGMADDTDSSTKVSLVANF